MRLNAPNIDLKTVIDAFNLEGEIANLQEFYIGHINDSFKLINKSKTYPDYFLQRINHNIFKDVNGMMSNIQLVTDHIKKKTFSGIIQTTLDLVPTKSNDCFYKDKKNNFWRIYKFKNKTKSYEVVETSEQAYQGARAFGLFLRHLEDFNPKDLVHTIPNFHNVLYRIEQLKVAIAKGDQKRVEMAKAEIKLIYDFGDQMSQIEKMKISNKIPTRVTHNDTKFNNVLFNQEDKVICVVDLDTVMPGIVHYDFGDGIRTATNTAAEDEQNLSLVNFDFDKYKGFASGYLDCTRDILKSIELEMLGMSGALLSYIMGVRFLTDFISLDLYYKIEYPRHNFVRAKCQLELTKKILEQMSDIEKFTAKEAGFAN